MKRIGAFLLSAIMLFTLSGCGKNTGNSGGSSVMESKNNSAESSENISVAENLSSGNSSENSVNIPENFTLIKGGTFQMGSPENEPWRGSDEVLHTVAVSDFYMSIYEVTQTEYREITGENPSNFNGDDLPVENVSWLDAIKFCNAKSEKESLVPAYKIDGNNVTWERSADGYRLPTEAKWEYACRAGTTTPFNTENSISAEEANYYGHYPYEIEDNYFSQGNLTTKPGEFRQTTVAVNSFSPNKFGLYNMHGNVGEWVWDLYGEYGTDAQTDPTGAESGNLRVYHGGGWNDFAKNMRSAYRATLDENKGAFNIGIRLVRNAAQGSGSVSGTGLQTAEKSGEKTLIAFFSWGGNTCGIANEIQSQTGADLFEIEHIPMTTTPFSMKLSAIKISKLAPKLKTKSRISSSTTR